MHRTKVRSTDQKLDNCKKQMCTSNNLGFDDLMHGCHDFCDFSGSKMPDACAESKNSNVFVLG